ncbi:MAG: hypothetical protein EOP51_25925 [Sphingobacteriales bacterium]|nr:MAG: hypothetical protein EOP51_25925 [Sphingobacteriales bacterium]
MGGYALQNGAGASLWTYSSDAPGHNNQKWKLRNVGNGYFTMMNLGSGKYLEARAINQQAVQNQKVVNDDKQLWKVEALTGGGYKIISKFNNLALSNPGPLNSNSPVGLGNFVNPTYQGWTFTIIPNDCYRDDDVIRFFQRKTGSSAFDGGSSVPLSTGHVLWLTNDTFYNQVNADGNFGCRTIFPYRNSSLLQPASKSWDPTLTVNIMSPFGVETFRTTNNTNLLWPGAAIQAGNKVYVHNIEVPRFNLNTTNQYLSEMSVGTTPTQIPLVKNLSIPGMTGQTAIIYSIGMVKPGDGMCMCMAAADS